MNGDRNGAPPMTISMDPFKVAEWFGWGHGDFSQLVFTLPPGIAVSAYAGVPEDEVWWITYSIMGDIPSSVLKAHIITSNDITGNGEDLFDTLIHEGWIGTPFCPPGWHRCDGEKGVHCTFTNVSGDPMYNTLPPQAVFLHMTFLLFKVKKKYVKKMDKWIMDMVGGI